MDTLQIQHVVHWGSNPSEKIRPNQQWPTIHEKVHNMRTTATHKDRTFRKSSTTGQVQDNFNQVPRTCNKQTCYDPQLQGCLIWHCHLSDPFYSSIIGSSLYLSSSHLQHVQIKYNKLARTSQNGAVKNCRQVELHNHDNCENCCIHRPMSPHVSNCMQVTSN